MIREEGVSSLFRGAGPNVVRAVLMNASQLASYDFFKAKLLKTSYFEDNIACHFTASFATGTVATTVCSPADVLKSRIMNASGPGSGSTLTVMPTNQSPMSTVLSDALLTRQHPLLPRKPNLLCTTEPRA